MSNEPVLTDTLRCVRFVSISSCWRHQMETFSALLALCAGNSPVTGEFPSQRPVTRSFDVFFDLRLNKRLSKQSRRRWFETLSPSLWRHYHVQYFSDVSHYLELILENKGPFFYIRQTFQAQGFPLQRKDSRETVLYIFIMGIPMLVRRDLYVEKVPCSLAQ